MRIRSIKPEFWRDEVIVSLPVSARLTFIGLWSYVDDNGVGDARLSSIVGDLYADDMSRDPRETIASVSRDLQVLEDAGLTVSYQDPDRPIRQLIFIRSWAKHQKIDRPSKGNCYPLPPAEILEKSDTRALCASVSRVSRADAASGAGEQGNRGAGELARRTSHLPLAELPTDESPHRCEQHRGLGAPPPCHDCADIREGSVDHTAAEIARRHQQRSEENLAIRSAIEDCDLCDDKGMRIGRVEWCNHEPIDTDTARRGLQLARAAITRPKDTE